VPDFVSECRTNRQDSLGRVDVLQDRIYQESTITYTVKNDPETEEVVVNGFAIYHKGLKDAQMKR